MFITSVFILHRLDHVDTGCLSVSNWSDKPSKETSEQMRLSHKDQVKQLSDSFFYLALAVWHSGNVLD